MVLNEPNNERCPVCGCDTKTRGPEVLKTRRGWVCAGVCANEYVEEIERQIDALIEKICDAGLSVSTNYLEIANRYGGAPASTRKDAPRVPRVSDDEETD